MVCDENIYKIFRLPEPYIPNGSHIECLIKMNFAKAEFLKQNNTYGSIISYCFNMNLQFEYNLVNLLRHINCFIIKSLHLYYAVNKTVLQYLCIKQQLH